MLTTLHETVFRSDQFFAVDPLDGQGVRVDAAEEAGHTAERSDLGVGAALVGDLAATDQATPPGFICEVLDHHWNAVNIDGVEVGLVTGAGLDNVSFGAGQLIYEKYGNCADAWMTLVGYFIVRQEMQRIVFLVYLHQLV